MPVIASSLFPKDNGCPVRETPWQHSDGKLHIVLVALVVKFTPNTALHTTLHVLTVWSWSHFHQSSLYSVKQKQQYRNNYNFITLSNRKTYMFCSFTILSLSSCCARLNSVSISCVFRKCSASVFAKSDWNCFSSSNSLALQWTHSCDIHIQYRY